MYVLIRRFSDMLYIILSYILSFFYNQTPPKSVKKILVLELAHIGDIIMTTPLLNSLRHNFPQAHITFICGSWAEPLLRNNPYVNEIVTYNSAIFTRGSKKTSFVEAIKLFNHLRKSNYDLLIDLRGDYASLFFCLLGLARSRIEWWASHIIERKLNKLEYEHYVDSKLRILEKAGLSIQKSDLELKTDENTKKFVKNYFKSKKIAEKDFVVVIAPGSGWQYRRWPKEKFALLADKLIQENNARILFIGNKKERELCGYIASLMKHDAINSAGDMSLMQTAELIRNCRLFIGNDSSPMHIASAFKVPTVALFGSNPPTLTGPKNKNSMILWHKTPCCPCHQLDCKSKDWCMDKITVEEAFIAVQKLIKKI